MAGVLVLSLFAPGAIDFGSRVMPDAEPWVVCGLFWSIPVTILVAVIVTLVRMAARRAAP